MPAGTINARRGDWNREGRQKRASRRRQFAANTAPLFKAKKVTSKRAKYVERKKRKLLQEAEEAGLLDDSDGGSDAMMDCEDDDAHEDLHAFKPKPFSPVSLAGPSKKGQKKTARRKAAVAMTAAASAARPARGGAAPPAREERGRSKAKGRPRLNP